MQSPPINVKVYLKGFTEARVNSVRMVELTFSSTVGELITTLCMTYPFLEKYLLLQGERFCGYIVLNNRIVDEDKLLQDGDTVIIFPPLLGG